MADVMYTYYEFEVTLREAEPRVWRRFLLRADLSFHDLHKAIQDACGWTESHLFAFRHDPYGDAIAGIPILDEFEGTIDPDAKQVKLSTLFNRQAACLYIYDFGDHWIHEVVRTGKVKLPYKFKRALMDGQRAFPPEDCGGIGGYELLVEFCETGVHEWGEDPDELRMWLGKWTPDGFSLAKSKRRFDK